MFVGETGVARVIERTCQLMKLDPNEDARAQGGIDLPTIQKYVNFWLSSSLDLFGGEISSNAADYFAAGLKGRDREAERDDDHVALAGSYRMQVIEDGRLVDRDVPLRNAMNEILRDSYIEDNERVVGRWNQILRDAGISFELRLPSRRFNRKVGIYGGRRFDPEGRPISEEEWQRRSAEWLPSESDRAHVKSLMLPVLERGKMAHWIAIPKRGIKGLPWDWEYIRRA